jgi:hypothetical protein
VQRVVPSRSAVDRPVLHLAHNAPHASLDWARAAPPLSPGLHDLPSEPPRAAGGRREEAVAKQRTVKVRVAVEDTTALLMVREPWVRNDSLGGNVAKRADVAASRIGSRLGGRWQAC